MEICVKFCKTLGFFTFALLSALEKCVLKSYHAVLTASYPEILSYLCLPTNVAEGVHCETNSSLSIEFGRSVRFLARPDALISFTKHKNTNLYCHWAWNITACYEDNVTVATPTGNTHLVFAVDNHTYMKHDI